jgi:glutathione S-transferase
LLELQSDEVFFPIVKQLMDLRSGGDSVAMAATRAQVNAFYDKMEGILQHSRFLAGEYSYVDIAFIMAHYFAAYLGSDLGSEHDNLRQWRTRMTQRPAVHSVGLVPPAFAYP